MRILLVHGVGYPETTDPQWFEAWETVIRTQLTAGGYQGIVDFQTVPYDQIFQDNYQQMSWAKKLGDYAKAVAELVASVVTTPIANFFHPGATRDMGETAQSHAGIVAQWVVNDNNLQSKCRDRIFQNIDAFQPDIICAHSLGSLLCYDLFVNDPRGAKAAGKRTLLTFGSQIANPFVCSKMWAGRVRMVNVKQWFHLYNPNDPVFTHDISLSDDNFRSVQTQFGGAFVDLSAHNPTSENSGHVGYLDHPSTIATVWPALAAPVGASVLSRSFSILSRALEIPKRRALLVGIDDYPDPANRLEGCVNDVFRISEALQERGFKAENIRVLLNERATKDAIVDRLHWLLDDADDKQERVFTYSGHGAEIPQYGVGGKVDHVDECLVPYDFDWSPEHAFSDKDFYALYSQLSYETQFLAIFDCCHSGGMMRDGGARVRGISPPDDIRHRLLEWNPKRQMWQQRDLEPIGKAIGKNACESKHFFGSNGATVRLGRATALRQTTSGKYDQMRKKQKHDGPFLPVVFEACREDQLSYEYRHGATSYGAFTYSLTQELRRLSKRTSPTYNHLIEATRQTLVDLKYNQTPQAVGPQQVLSSKIPKATSA